MARSKATRRRQPGVSPRRVQHVALPVRLNWGGPAGRFPARHSINVPQRAGVLAIDLPGDCSFRIVLLIPPVALRAADWQPAKGPLTTRWAKDVAPDKVHPEYPRPQLVRSLWQNLNGLWQCELADKHAGQPPAEFRAADPGAVSGRVGPVGRDEA